MESVSLEGRVAIVTGASRGIGRAIALRLARHGAIVEAVARDSARLDALRAEAPSIATHIADVGSEADVTRVVDAIDRRHGRIDILVNSAGIGVFGPIETMSWEDFARVLHVNVGGAFLFVRAVVPRMKRACSGEIISIASVVGWKGYAHQSVYGASKHALVGLTKALAVELQPFGIRVRSISPGGVATDLIARARPDLDPGGLIQPDDVADAVAWLLTASPTAVVDDLHLRRSGGEPWF